VKATNAIGASPASKATVAVSPFSTISGARWKAKSKGKSVKVTFKAISGASSYGYTLTGATNKSGSCSVKGKGSKATVKCALSLKKGITAVVITARTKAKTDLAKVSKALVAKK
jgi:hypothetical protein